MQCGSDRGAGEESGNAGGSVRDPGHRRIQNVDAGAMAALVRRKGRVGIRGVGGCSRYKKLGGSAPPHRWAQQRDARSRDPRGAGASA